MPIYDLRDYPEHLETLASWHQEEWAHLNPGQTLGERLEKMQSYLNEDFIPTTFIYLQGDELCGSAAIISSDMDTHPELTPWLASVYVNPEVRGMGIASKLVQHVSTLAKANGWNSLYLYTPGQEALYAKLGWQTFATEIYHNTEVTLMHLQLS